MSFSDLVLTQNEPMSKWSLTYGFKDFTSEFEGIDFNGDWTFFAVVKLLTPNKKKGIAQFILGNNSRGQKIPELLISIVPSVSKKDLHFFL